MSTRTSGVGAALIPLFLRSKPPPDQPRKALHTPLKFLPRTKLFFGDT